MGENPNTSINGEIALTLPAFITDIEKQEIAQTQSMPHSRRNEEKHVWEC